MKPTIFTIITSELDPAGKNIKSELKKLNIETFEVEQDIVCPEHVDKEKQIQKSDFLIFASWHKSEIPNKTLSVHPVGNFKTSKSEDFDSAQKSEEMKISDKAQFGGKEGILNYSDAFFQKYLFQTLNKIATEEKVDYKITMEITHHGPEIDKPCCFIEIGSSEKEWNDKKAVKIIAETIKTAIETYDKQKEKLTSNWISAIAIGGKHYASSFNKIQLNSNYAISHIIPDYQFPINETIIAESIHKTLPKPKIAIIDWKSLKSEQRKQAIDLLNKFNLKIIRTSQIEK